MSKATISYNETRGGFHFTENNQMQDLQYFGEDLNKCILAAKAEYDCEMPVFDISCVRRLQRGI